MTKSSACLQSTLRRRSTIAISVTDETLKVEHKNERMILTMTAKPVTTVKYIISTKMCNTEIPGLGPQQSPDLGIKNPVWIALTSHISLCWCLLRGAG